MYGATHRFPSFNDRGENAFCAVGLELYLKVLQLRQELQDEVSGNLIPELEKVGVQEESQYATSSRQ